MTGIRGMAALWVLLFHAQQSAGRIFNLRILEIEATAVVPA